jgi:hypothetical protein
MRFSKRKYPPDGTKRERFSFLLFPKGMDNENGDYEVRWLENSKWIEKFQVTSDGIHEWFAQQWLSY